MWFICYINVFHSSLALSKLFTIDFWGFFWETKNVMHYTVSKDHFQLHRQGNGMWRKGEEEDFTHCKFLRFLWAHLDNKGTEVSLSVVNSIRLPTAISEAITLIINSLVILWRCFVISNHCFLNKPLQIQWGIQRKRCCLAGKRLSSCILGDPD